MRSAKNEMRHQMWLALGMVALFGGTTTAWSFMAPLGFVDQQGHIIFIDPPEFIFPEIVCKHLRISVGILKCVN